MLDRRGGGAAEVVRWGTACETSRRPGAAATARGATARRARGARRLLRDAPRAHATGGNQITPEDNNILINAWKHEVGWNGLRV